MAFQQIAQRNCNSTKSPVKNADHKTITIWGYMEQLSQLHFYQQLQNRHELILHERMTFFGSCRSFKLNVILLYYFVLPR